VEAYNLALRKWFPLAPLSQGCDSGAACCVVRDDVWVCEAGEGRQGLVRFSSEDNQWHVIASMTLGRRGHCLVAVGNHLYVLGGVTEVSNGSPGSPTDFPTSSPTTVMFPRPTISSVIECYDVDRNRWSVVGGLAEPVWGASAVAFKGKIYLFGGFPQLVMVQPTKL
jgi:hypothetical protein